MTKTHFNLPFMRFLMVTVAMILFLQPSFALTAPASLPAPARGNASSSSLSNMNVQEFLALTPKKYTALTGEKLSFTQKISLKIVQKKISKALSRNEKADRNTMAAALDTSDFNIGGFVLGLLLSVIGVLIAYLIDDSSVIKWAWIGFGVFLIIFLLTLIL